MLRSGNVWVHAMADPTALDRAPDRPAHAHPRMAFLRDPRPGEVEPPGRRDHLHQLPVPLPADHRRRGHRRRHTQHPADAGARTQARRAGARNLRQARPQHPRGQRGHHRCRRRRRTALHRPGLDRLPARVPARRLGVRGEPRQPGPAAAEGRGRAAGPGRGRPGLAGLLHVRHVGRGVGRREGRAAGRRRPAHGGGLLHRRARRPPADDLRAVAPAGRPSGPVAARAGRADRRDRLRTPQAAAERLSPGRRGQEHVRRVRRPGGAAPLDQLHGEADALLRGVDGDAALKRVSASCAPGRGAGGGGGR